MNQNNQKITTLFTLSANRLQDGCVVYITKDSSWSENPQDALLCSSSSQAEELLLAHDQHQIIAPYIISINQKDHQPSLFREQLRTLGPSVRKDLGRQAQKPSHKP